MSLMNRLTCGFEELSLSVLEIWGNVKGHYFYYNENFFDLLKFFEYDIIFLVTYSIIVIHLIVTV